MAKAPKRISSVTDARKQSLRVDNPVPVSERASITHAAIVANQVERAGGPSRGAVTAATVAFDDLAAHVPASPLGARVRDLIPREFAARSRAVQD